MISRKFPALVIKSGDTHVRVPVQVQMTYDGESDPFAVQMILSQRGEDECVWYVSRELLLAGINSLTSVGNGYVRFRFSGAGNGISSLYVCLENPNGHADIAFPHGEVVAFLNDTTDAALEGIGLLGALIDEGLEDILNG